MKVDEMQVHVRAAPAEVHQSIRDRVTADVSESLQSVKTDGERFVINDTLWYGLNRQGKATQPSCRQAEFRFSRNTPRTLNTVTSGSGGKQALGRRIQRVQRRMCCRV